MFTIQWTGLILPFLYVVVLNASVYSIYSLYQKHKAAKTANLAPWFPSHLQRDIYLSLLHLSPQTGITESKPTTPVPQSVIRAALLRRAIEDIHRVGDLRSKKQACASLLEKRSISDVLWHQLLRAEADMDKELRDVVEEANELARGWGQTIFQTANEIVANEKLREGLMDIQGRVGEEKRAYTAVGISA
ncbi:hypothetical protein IFR05_000671 [Cadophora sp. M221]|nr:hypothetical protein IFR05_000671 [Cadophora sp. M221]